MSDIFLGFDPGGERGFGVALLCEAEVSATTVNSVAEAIGWVASKCHSNVPTAAGIDAMLYWCDGRGGWRPADRSLRATYPGARASVMSPNGLYGSMGIGGMAAAIRLRQRWPNIVLNETHPKVLAYSLRNVVHRDNDPAPGIAWFGEHAGLDMTGVTGGHEFDAVLSAWATRKGLSLGWRNLIADDPTLLFPAGTVCYLWPEDITRAALAKSPSSGPAVDRSS